MIQLDLVRNSQVECWVRKLVEYWFVYYVLYLEVVSYFINIFVWVQFCFVNLIICCLGCGYKIMSVLDSDVFDFMFGDVMFVLLGLEIDIDLSMVCMDVLIECDCIEIENECVELVFG